MYGINKKNYIKVGIFHFYHQIPVQMTHCNFQYHVEGK
jgi:hypothetical protein